MQQVKRRDTAPELKIRSRLHARGMRYYVDKAPLRGVHRKADIVFPRVRVAVFIDGCFWHGCPEHIYWPKTNAGWWRQKIEANAARDRQMDARLRSAGWTVLRVWEHDDPDVAASWIERLVRNAAGVSVK